MNRYYAHWTENPDKSDWQGLPEHLLNVAELARSFAGAFGAGPWGYRGGCCTMPARRLMISPAGWKANP